MKSRILMRYLRLPRNTNVAKNEMQLFYKILVINNFLLPGPRARPHERGATGALLGREI
jgi:hypothetical protein